MKFEFRTAGCGGGAPGFKSKPLTAGTQLVPACQIRDGVGAYKANGTTWALQDGKKFHAIRASMRLYLGLLPRGLYLGSRRTAARPVGMATPRLRRRWNATYHSLALLVAPRELHLRVPPR
jgi:hypothetical protein